MRRWICVSILICLVAGSSMGQNTIYNQRKQQYLATNGEGLWYFHERVWAWLENIKNGQIDGNTYKVYDVDGEERSVNQVIHNIIRSWATSWSSQSEYPPYGHAWRWSFWFPSVTLFWIYQQYGDIISSTDLQFLEDLYRNYVQSKDFAPYQPNQCTHDMVGRYLYLQSHKSYDVVYSEPGNNVMEFEYEGRQYSLGNTYNAYQLARDWIFNHMEMSVKKGHAEFDSPDYTHALMHSYISLYQFAQDEEMKRRAKMMVDFYFLDSILDFCGSQWGGSLGRTYAGSIESGKSKDYIYAFWDILPPTYEPSFNIFVSNYRLPDLIWDIGDLSDEADNYYHLNMEGNYSIMSTSGTGKWNYVTKFYSLGGQCNGSWQLSIKSSDTPSSTRRPGVPFRLWINDLEEGADTTNPVDYMTFKAIGLRGYQYKNAIFVLNGFYFHYAIGKNQFDHDEQIGDYRFLQEGRTMVAFRIRTEKKTAGMQVAIQGVDFPSMQDFQTAIFNNCDLDGGKFINVKGDWVGSAVIEGTTDREPTVKLGGITDVQPVYDFPFKRLQCVDNLKRYIVKWDNNVMTVRRHGRQSIYNFNTWTTAESTYEMDYVPPGAPTGVSVQPGL